MHRLIRRRDGARDLVERFGEDAYTGGYTCPNHDREIIRPDSRQPRSARDASTTTANVMATMAPRTARRPLPAEQAALDAALADRPTVGALRPAIVTAVTTSRRPSISVEGQGARLGTR